MAATSVPEAYAALTADGTADGYATVADNTPFYPGATCWIWSSTQPSLECIVTNLVGTTKVGLRAKPGLLGTASTGPQYGRTPLGAYKLVDGAKINQEASVVPMQSYGSVVKKLQN